MGVLALSGKLSGERFDRDDEALLTTLANQAALAIETALLHDQTLLEVYSACAKG